MFLSNTVLNSMLEGATKEELIALSSIVKEKEVISELPLSELTAEICKIGGHSLINIFRGEGTGYLDILDDIADELNITGLPSYNTNVKYFDEIEDLKYDKETAREFGIKYAELVEEKIILKVLEMSYENMTMEDKKTFDEQINEISKKFNSNSTTYLTGSAGLLALGKLGGFATYTFLTSSLSVLSFGSLGFATYTGATTLLGVMLGPIGWAGLGAITILTLGSPNTKRLIPIVATIGAIRQRIKYDNEKIKNLGKL